MIRLATIRIIVTLLFLSTTLNLLCSSSAWSAPLKILTLNTWILKDPIFGYAISKDNDIRLALLPSQIEKSKADLVFIQELWPQTERAQLIQSLKQMGYPYVIESRASQGSLKGILGNGLLIVSKYELDPNYIDMAFSDYTRIEEFFAAKGAIKSRVKIPRWGWVDVYNTHLGAVTTVKGEFDPHELDILNDQVHELRGFVSATRTEKFAIIAGDFNSHYRSYRNFAYQEDFSSTYSTMTCLGKDFSRDRVSQCLGFVDTYRTLHGFNNGDWTYDTNRNLYAHTGHFEKEPAGVLDYIYVSPELQSRLSRSEIVFNKEMTLGYEKGDTKNLFVTDHFGVLTTLSDRPTRKKWVAPLAVR